MPPEEPQDANDEEAVQHQEEEKLRQELLEFIATNNFKFSSKVVEKVNNLEQLQQIWEIYERQRARHLGRLVTSYLAVFITKGLHHIDCLGEHQVEPLQKSLTEDELLEDDLVWLLGKLINKVPCAGVVFAGGKIGIEVVKHKYGKKIKAGIKRTVALIKETREEVNKKKSVLPPKKRNSLSSVSSQEEEP